MIDAYEFGRIVIGGEEYRADVVVYPDRVDASWWRAEGHSLCMADLEAALAGGPEVLVVGQGASGLMRVPGEVRQALRARGVELFAASTAEAVEKYNALAGTKRVVAALHLTC